mgnify:CR=1 FL=1
MTAAVSKRVLQAGQIMTVIVQNHHRPVSAVSRTGPRPCPNPLIPDSEFSIKTQVGPNVKRIEGDRVIRFENVGLRYGSGPEILRDVTFHVVPGSFHFLTGPSGAGKTTLLRLLFMSLRPTRGLIFVFGENVSDLSSAGRAELRRRIGIVFQDFRLLEHLTTWENVALPLRVMGKKESDYREDVTDLLRWVGLGDRIDAYPEILSGGEKQRAAIARAVIGRPELSARRRAHRQRRSDDRRSPVAAVRRAQSPRHLGDHRHPRLRADGSARRPAPRALRRPSGDPLTAVQLIADIRDYPWRNLFAGILPARFQPKTAQIVPSASIAGNALTVVIAIMSFLACLTAGAVYMVNQSAEAWVKDISSEITVELDPVNTADIEKKMTLVSCFSPSKPASPG